MKKVIGISILVVIVIALGAVLLLSKPARRHGETINVGYLPITVNVPFFVALEKDYFKQEGVDVRAVRFESTTELFNAMIAGRAPVTAVGGIPSLYALEGQEAGQFKMYWFNANDETRFVDNFIVRKDSPILSFGDLKGRRLGVFPGTTSEMAARIILRKFGLTAGENVELLPIPPQNHLQALEMGRVDALISMEPTGTLALLKGVGKVIEQAPQEKHIMNPFPGGAAAFQNKWLDTHRREAGKIKRAIDRAIAFTEENTEQAKGSLSKYTGIPQDTAVRTRLCLYWTLESADRKAIQDFADLLYKEKVLPKTVDTRTMYLAKEDLTVNGEE